MTRTATTADMKKGTTVTCSQGTEWTVISVMPYGWNVRGWTANGRHNGTRVMFADELQHCTINA